MAEVIARGDDIEEDEKMHKFEQIESSKKELYKFVDELATGDKIQSDLEQIHKENPLKRKVIEIVLGDTSSSTRKKLKIEFIKNEVFHSMRKNDKTFRKYLTKISQQMLFLEIILRRLNSKK